jgi:hypothetical protein
MFLIPDAAVLLDQTRHLVLMVAPDGTVVPKTVETGDVCGGLRIIRSGLSPDDRVIIEGLLTHPLDRRSAARTARFATLSPARSRTEPEMRLTHFFIDRPRFAVVLSTFVTLLGLGALAVLPVAQYPEVVPPTVQVRTSYPGASAQTVARTVATPLEQQINGVENMIYMSSQSTGDGNLTITSSSANSSRAAKPRPWWPLFLSL